VDQNTVRQLDGLQLDKVFTDKASGKDTKRPQLQAALDYLRDGDVLVVHSMDRLARSLSDLLALVKRLTERSVTVEFVKESRRGSASRCVIVQLNPGVSFHGLLKPIPLAHSGPFIAGLKKSGAKGVLAPRVMKVCLVPTCSCMAAERSVMADTKELPT
jgi:hypothetical protein